MQIWSAEIKELDKFYFSLKGHLDDLEKELNRLINADDENMALIYARRCLEVIVTDLCETELNRPRKTEPLKGIIDKLNHEEKVPSHIIASMMNVNSLSTFGAHPKEFDPEEVRPVLISLATIFKWYLKFKNIEINLVPETKEVLNDEQVHEESHRPKKKVIADETKAKGSGSILFLIRKPQIIIPWVLLIIAILGTLVYLLNHRSKIKWAKEKAIPEIDQLANQGKYIAAFDLAIKAEKYIPGDSSLKKLWPAISSNVSTKSDPPGAKIYRRDYDATDTNWIFVGETPLDNIRIPYSFSRIKLEKEGFYTVYDVSNSMQLNLRDYHLDTLGTLPKNMVRIPGIKISVDLPYLTHAKSLDINDFLIDRFEVTNKEYKIFIDSGGYQKKEYWKYPFTQNGEIISWEQAMSLFVDKTDRNGPSAWEAGDYQKGEDNYPVGGISWYEAAAYAEFEEKSLPTYYH
jgi:hypothetical protein